MLCQGVRRPPTNSMLSLPMTCSTARFIALSDPDRLGVGNDGVDAVMPVSAFVAPIASALAALLTMRVVSVMPIARPSPIYLPRAMVTCDGECDCAVIYIGSVAAFASSCALRLMAAILLSIPLIRPCPTSAPSPVVSAGLGVAASRSKRAAATPNCCWSNPCIGSGIALGCHCHGKCRQRFFG